MDPILKGDGVNSNCNEMVHLFSSESKRKAEMEMYFVDSITTFNDRAARYDELRTR